MSRWNLRLPHYKLVPRMSHFLERAAKLLPPKIRSAVFSTWWNRTCTARRFQGNGACPLCNDSRDEVEHWPACKVVRWWSTVLLNLPPKMLIDTERSDHTALAELLGLGLLKGDDNLLIRIGCLLYLVVDTHNAMRHDKEVSLKDATEWKQRGINVLKSAVAGHTKARKVVHSLPSFTFSCEDRKRSLDTTRDDSYGGRRRRV
jgi:hypothetical protein